ncbi:MAG: hypothetical protein PSX79_09190, partial [bacterium]|nr:hypothetical protein [bacterium]
QQQRASAQSYASSSSAAAPQVDTAQRQREDAAKQAQRARDQARDQELLALEQKQKDAAAAASKARKEQAEAARLAQREAEKAAKEQASLAYLQAVMRGTTLLARKCPGGEGKYYIVGKRPRISPEVEPCIDIEFRAHCPGSNAYTEGSGKNFIGIGTDCFTGDTYPIDPPGCPVEQVRVTVTKVTACVFGGK